LFFVVLAAKSSPLLLGVLCVADRRLCVTARKKWSRLKASGGEAFSSQVVKKNSTMNYLLSDKEVG
jgi:hypothetical protein